MLKRSISFLLALSMTAALVACGGEASSDDTTTGNQDSTTSENDAIAAALGFASEDNGGREFKILTSDYGAYEYNVIEETGDIVSDSIFNRNRKVEEYLGINFSYQVSSSDGSAWNSGVALNAAFQESVLAGDNDYDLVCSVAVATLPIAGEGYFVNVNDTSIDFDHPWWVNGLSEELSINGRLYAFIGDLSLSLYKDLCVVYFNKRILDENQMTSPYELVRDDRWIIDEFSAMAQAAARDLNGDDKMEPTVDQYGCMGQGVPNRAFLTTSGLDLVERDGDSIAFVTLPEAVVDVYDKLYALFAASDACYVDKTGKHSEYAGFFNDGHSLFMNTFLYAADFLRDMPDDYGIVPYPKRSEEQESYYSQIGTSTTMNFIPVTNDDLALTAKVCEALAYWGSTEVVPSYYEVALKDKYARDDDVQGMLDIIRAGATMNFCFAYSTCFSPYPNGIFHIESKNDKDGNLASWYASNLVKWTTQLEALIESYSK